MTLSPETDRALEDLVRTARGAGYADAIRDVSTFMVTVSHLKDPTELLSAIAKGIDAINTKGPSNA